MHPIAVEFSHCFPNNFHWSILSSPYYQLLTVCNNEITRLSAGGSAGGNATSMAKKNEPNQLHDKKTSAAKTGIGSWKYKIMSNASSRLPLSRTDNVALLK